MTGKQPDIEKYEALLTQDTVKKIQASFSILLFDYTEIWGTDYWRNTYPQPKELKEIRDRITEAVVQMKDIVDSGQTLYKAYAVDFANYKKTISKINKSVQAYLLQLKFLSVSARHYHNELFFTGTEPIPLDTDKICADCVNYVKDSRGNFAENVRKSGVISCFPVKMTRERYYDYIRKSARQVLGIETMFNAPVDSSFTDKYVAYLKFMFKPDESETYGAYFPEIIEKINNIKLFDVEHIDEPALQDFEKKITDLSDELEMIHDHLLLLFECVNSVIILATFPVDFDYLFDNHFAFKDAYFTLIENIGAADKELYRETVLEIFRSHLEHIMEDVQTLHERCEKLLDNPAYDNLPEHAASISKARSVVTSVFYENPEETALQDDRSSPIADPPKQMEPSGIQSYANGKIEELLEYIKSSLAKEPVKKQRLMKQLFMSSIVCPFNMDEFIEYLADGFGSARDNAQKALIASHVAFLFEDSMFRPDEYDRKQGKN